MDVTSTDDVGSQDITGSFGLSIYSPNLEDYSATFTAADPTGKLRIREGGQTVTLGCFSIFLTFCLNCADSFNDGYFDLAGTAVVNASGKVFSITTAGLGELVFGPYPEGGMSYPDAGGMRFYSFVLVSGQDGCAAVGSPNGVGNSDGSNFILSALPGDLDDVQLELRDAEDTIVYTEDTTWSALTD
jgi:hypothetical protein